MVRGEGAHVWDSEGREYIDYLLGSGQMFVGHAHPDVTAAVLAELQRAPDPRFKEIMGAAVRHLHGFVREAKLTEPEFHQICGVIARLGQLTNDSHNEVVLAAGSLGVSALVCLQNNGHGGEQPTTANLLGPFWREGVPVMPTGASIVRSTMRPRAISMAPVPFSPRFVTSS